MGLFAFPCLVCPMVDNPRDGETRKKARRLAHIDADAFAAISAVEGLKLSPAGESRRRLVTEKKQSPAERRAEIIRAYARPKQPA
jgi:hypothetical protein